MAAELCACTETCRYRRCELGECWCGEPYFADVSGICPGCGGDGECYCGEAD